MKKKKNFEEAMMRLEEIVRVLESGAQSLEESLALFEEGTTLAAFCNTTLSEAKLKITEMAADESKERLSGEKEEQANE